MVASESSPNSPSRVEEMAQERLAASAERSFYSSPVVKMITLKSTRQVHALVLVIFAFSILCQGVHCLPIRNSTDKKLDQLLYNSSLVRGNHTAIVQKVLTSLIRYGYLSSDLTAKSRFTGRPIIDFLDVHTARVALARYQKMLRLPITGLIDGSTLFEQTVPRCGNKDVDEPSFPFNSLKRHRRYNLYKNGRAKLRHLNLTYSILNYPKRSLSKHRVHRIIRRAVNTWARHSGLTFKEIRNDEHADIRVQFLGKNHGDVAFDGPHGVLGHAFFPGSGSKTGAVHLDIAENWTEGTTEGSNLFGIMTHELGHALGIGHSEVETSIMTPVFNGYQPHFRLDNDDIRAIQALYGRPEPNKVLEGDEDFYTLPPYSSTTPAPTTLPVGVPLVCETTIDTILPVGGYELHVFHGQFFWRVSIQETGDGFFSYELTDNPRLFNRYWRGLPENLDRVDAAYERHDGKFMFFRGSRFWVLQGNNNRVSNIPAEGRPLQELGLPSYVTKVDTMFRWGYVPPYEDPRHYPRRAFIFSGELYWEFRESSHGFGGVDTRRYPIRITDSWLNLPTPVDAAYTHVDSQTYFFKNYHYYSFNNRLMRVRDGYPKRSKLPWLGCTVNLMIRSS